MSPKPIAKTSPLTIKPVSSRTVRFHQISKGILCDLEAPGQKSPGGVSPAELVLDAPGGAIPLWDEDVTLNWRFQDRSFDIFENPNAAKKVVEGLFAQALLRWGDAAPIRFRKSHEAWDFEIVIQPSAKCNANGCVLASAFFPDAGQHKLFIYPTLFEQSEQEKVETLIHEIGHTFGLRHFFANVEAGFPYVKFGRQNPFTIMNYGDKSTLTDEDKEDLKTLYKSVWSGALTKINGTP